MSASWFLVSMYLIWIFWSKVIQSNNQSRATLWVLETCLIVGLLPLIIILITASVSSNTYSKAFRRADWTFEGTASMSFITSILLWDLWCLWSSLSSFPDRSETRETLPRTETIRSHSSRAGKPSNLSPVSKEMIFRFCWTVRNSSLFLAHPTYWNKCVTSKKAQCSSRSGFWIFKISCDVRVLKTVPVCIVLQCYPHNSTVYIHTYDEHMKSIDSGVCHKLWSILLWIVRAYSPY